MSGHSDCKFADSDARTPKCVSHEEFASGNFEHLVGGQTYSIVGLWIGASAIPSHAEGCAPTNEDAGARLCTVLTESVT